MLATLLENGGRELVTLALREMPYGEFLKTAHWAAVRESVLRAARWTCRLCGKRAWQAHHLTYERLGNEAPGDVAALCGDCHKIWHETWVQRARFEGEQQFGAGSE